MSWTGERYFVPVRHSRYIPAASAFDSATLAWVAAVIANGGTVSNTRETLVDNLIVGLKADGLFTKLDRLWLFAAENAASALTDIVADSLATAVNTPTFTTDRGYTGDGATNYIDSNANLSTFGGQYAQDSAMMSCWSLTSGQAAVQDIGAADGVPIVAYMYLRYIDDNAYLRINRTGVGGSLANANGSGLIMASRTSSSNVDGYRNGASLGSLSPDTASGLPNANVFFLGFNDNGGLIGSTRQFAMGALGGSFTASDASNFYTRLRTYMTAVGVP